MKPPILVVPVKHNALDASIPQATAKYAIRVTSSNLTVKHAECSQPN